MCFHCNIKTSIGHLYLSPYGEGGFQKRQWALKLMSSYILTSEQKVNIGRYGFIQCRILKSCKIWELIRVFETPYMTNYGAWNIMQINTVLQVLNDV